MALLEQQQQRHTRSIRGQPQQHNRSALRRLFVAHVLQCLSTTIREQAAPGLVFSMFRNDIVGTAKFLGNYDSASGLVAFLVSPSFGSLSDAFGRKPFLLLWPVASTVLSALVAWRPHKLLVFVQMALLGALVNAFETSVRSVIPDLTPTGDARAIANANIGACQGLAFFIGSGITGMLSQVDPRLSMAAASVTSVVAGLVLTSMPETLRHKRTPFVLRKANPFGFLDLWKSSSEYNLRTRGAIRRLALPFALQKTVWPGLNEQIHIYAAGQLNWQPADFARYMTLVGVGHLIGNKLTGPTLRLFGGQMHSHVANLLFALMFSLIGSAHMRMGWGTRQIHSAQVWQLCLDRHRNLAPFTIDCVCACACMFS
jgi:MFS family permease